MHKGVILLTKASSREEALYNIIEFMEPYGNGDVWDWYSVGGRWHNTLAPSNKMKEFTDWVHETYKEAFKDFGYAVNDLENDEVRPYIQKKWENLGLKGFNPYWDAYGFSINSNADSEDYNIVPLSECLDTVQEWCKDLKEESEKMFDKMLEAIEEAKKGEYDMSGYYAGIYKDLKYGLLSFESNVYNITEYTAEKIPDDITRYWAVMIDMHN